MAKHTHVSNPLVELHPVGQLADWMRSLHPLARVGGQVALALTSVVEKAAAREIVVVAAETTANSASRLTNQNRRGRKGIWNAADVLVP